MMNGLLVNATPIIIGVVAAVFVVAVVSSVIATVLKKKKTNGTASKPTETIVDVNETAEEESAPIPEQTKELSEEPKAESEILPAPVVEEMPVAPAETEQSGPAAENTSEMVSEEPAPIEEMKEVPKEEPAPEPEPQSEYAPGRIRKFVIAPAKPFISIRYDRSFTARIIQADDKMKAYYSELKNELLAYRRVRSRVSWRQDGFRLGRNAVARIEMRGKTLCLYLAIDPVKYEGSKYIVENVSDVKRNVFTPCMYRIKNDRRLRYAKELIAEMFAGSDTPKTIREPIDYTAEIPYESTDSLLDRGLIKLIEERKKADENAPFADGGEIEIEIRNDVTQQIAEDLIRDEVAQVLIQESENHTVRGKQTIVNVDTLGEYFENGEIVTLEDMKERIPFLNKKAECVKVLARGVLNKAITVEADDFSLTAVKMILLAGGTVYRKHRDLQE